MASFDYQSKAELIEAVHTGYLLLDGEYEGMPEDQKDVPVPEVDRTPAQIIAYQLGWLDLVMSWDRDEKAGRTVVMPAPGYKWNQLGGLYQSFYDQYADCSLADLRRLFGEAEKKWLDWIDTLSEEELFTQGVRKWTGDKPNWPMVRWIHINSVAPFKSFRAKLRKWKKHQSLTK
ncbi:ClbS/DfsB family four-helix bundle protein [Paenibacillus sp. J22TS3]|uniref:ClbS/DfsB family four-helix bundle protein n=1 Tax=Paenibacillus sp. J22TS3 TaxID=2807192 RepID=UPI001B277CE6|nr:ClbS/DfsB family four-helix bundle protein [Paenibacillus sp. J22TS3]GIP19975.1 hypothetical protein J22TS3_02500 [Paenibacillus sp. J22TS3]